MIHLNLLATLRSPLSHLSGEQHVWHEDGNVRKKRVVRLHMRKTLHYHDSGGMRGIIVPMYQGNSWRGLLRFHLGLMILDQLQDQGVTITKDIFGYCISSGGMISARKESSIPSLASFYDLHPTYWLLGGTFRGKHYRGHSAIGDWIPVCTEAISNHTIPDSMSAHAFTIRDHQHTDSYRTPLTNLTTITRRDPKLRPDLLRLVDSQELEDMLTEYQKSKSARDKVKTALPAQESTPEDTQSDDANTTAEQQIIATETVVEGTPFFGQMSVLDGEGPRNKWQHLERIGLGCLLIAMERFSRTPFIGGGYRQGFGRVELQLNVALSGSHILQNGISLTHVNGVPMFTIHPDLEPYKKAGLEAIGQLVNRIAQEHK